MPIASRFPSALQRDQATGSGSIRRKGLTAAEIAMLPADQLRDYYRRRGQWAEPDREAMAEMRKRDPLNCGR